MTSQRWAAPDFLGLTPAVDPRRSDKLYALSGRNYVFDSRGVKSPFGDRQLLPYALDNPAHIQGVRLKLRNGDRTFTFTSIGIIEWNETEGGWRFVYLTPDTTVQPYRWTWAYINGIMFFCHPQTGIIAYEVDSDQAAILEGEGVPENAIAITEDNGRLIVMDDVYLYWSAQSDGSDFTPTLGGAGFQQISDRVPGLPIMVTSYTQGVLTWTTGGVMRSEFTGDAAVYRHRAIESEYRPINSFCTVKVSQDITVILDERGLFQSQGEAPTPYATLFNEFLIDFLKRYKLKIGQNVRLEWDDLQRRLYLSVSLSYTNPVYERCFVLYPPLDKWGEFNDPHYGIFPLTIQSTERAADYYAFADESGLVRTWGDYGSREGKVVDRFADLCYPTIQKPFHHPGDEVGLVLSSSGSLQTVPGTQARRAAYYPRDGGLALIGPLVALNASIQLGLLRFTNPDDNFSRLADVTNIALGNVVAGPMNPDDPAFNVRPAGVGSQDYLLAIGDDSNAGVEESNFIDCDLLVYGTVDGRSVFDSAAPSLVRFDRATRHYSCLVGGVWHIISVAAAAVGQGFHVQMIECNFTDGGLLL